MAKRRTTYRMRSRPWLLSLVLVSTLFLLIPFAPVSAFDEEVLLSEFPPVEVIDIPTTFARGSSNCFNLETTRSAGANTYDVFIKKPHEAVEGPFKPSDAPFFFTTEDYLFCPIGTKDSWIELGQYTPPAPTLKWWEEVTIGVAMYFLFVFAWVGAWLVYLGALLVSPLISLSSFITHPMVRTGWPFILGFANLGFIIALLFIAFATMLQSETMGARRMLPRLLLAAILINFSLIIAGVILDLSRLMMAIMVRSIAGGADGVSSLANLGASLLKSSDLLKTTFDLGTLKNIGLNVSASEGWGVIFKVARATMLIWFLAAGFVILIAGLLVRYIILILLLIVSPLAYLALAFPNMGDYAKTWWRLFLKYVFYGPIALFILIMVSRLNATEGRDPILDIFTADGADAALQGVLSVIITGVMFVAAAMAGSKFGIIGASAAMGFANKRGRQLAGGMTKAAYVGLGGRKLKYFGSDLARDYSKSLATKARKGEKVFGVVPGTVAKFIAGTKRDKDGKPAKGQAPSIGQKAAVGLARFTGAADKKTEEQVAQARQFAAQAKGPGDVRTLMANPAFKAFLSSGALTKGRATAQFKPNILVEIARQATDINTLQHMGSNEDMLHTMNDTERTDLVQAIATNPNVSAGAKRKTQVVREVKDSAGKVLRTETEEHETDLTADALSKLADQIGNKVNRIKES